MVVIQQRYRRSPWKAVPRHVVAIAFVAAMMLAVCNGGGGAVPRVRVPAVLEASATPSVDGSAIRSAAVSGIVVDLTSSRGLAGIPVAIARYADEDGSYSTVATSAPDGRFTFTASPATYVVAIGSNNASDDKRATEHDIFTFVAGSNAIAGPIESPEPSVTLMPSQRSGSFRLAKMTNVERTCIAGMNAGRMANRLAPLMADEESLELSRAFLVEQLHQRTDEPRPLFDDQGSFAATGEDSYDAGAGFATCSTFTNTYSFDSSDGPFEAANTASTAWFAASFGKNGSTYVNEIFGSDPKNDPPSTSIRVR